MFKSKEQKEKERLDKERDDKEWRERRNLEIERDEVARKEREKAKEKSAKLEAEKLEIRRAKLNSVFDINSDCAVTQVQNKKNGKTDMYVYDEESNPIFMIDNVHWNGKTTEGDLIKNTTILFKKLVQMHEDISDMHQELKESVNEIKDMIAFMPSVGPRYQEAETSFTETVQNL